MEALSWSEVDDLRGRLSAEDRAAFDAQLRELTSRDLDDDAVGHLLTCWFGVAHPQLTNSTSAA